MTTRMSKPHDIDHLASQWVIREHFGPLDASQQRALQEWLDQDVRHLGAYARAHAAWLHLERARALDPSPAIAASSSAQQASLASRRRLLAAGLGAIAAMPALVWGVRQASERSSRTYRTVTGELHRIPLEDGSLVTLDSGSVLRVHFERDRRSIVLLQGQALFDVAKDRRRPFVVHAGATRVTAIGTSFSVSADGPRQVQVAVREGTVEIAGNALAAVRASANHVAVVGAQHATSVEPVSSEHMDDLLSWREGMLSFDGAPLAEVINRFSRYSTLKIVIDDPALRERQVVGRYSATNPRGFAHAIAASMDLQMREHDGALHLSRKASQQHMPSRFN